MLVLLQEDKVDDGSDCTCDFTGGENKKKVVGRPKKDKFNKQDSVYKLYLNTGEDAVASDLMEYHKIAGISDLCRFLIREDAVKNDAALKQMRKDRRECLDNMNNIRQEQEQ